MTARKNYRTVTSQAPPVTVFTLVSSISEHDIIRLVKDLIHEPLVTFEISLEQLGNYREFDEMSCFFHTRRGGGGVAI